MGSRIQKYKKLQSGQIYLSQGTYAGRAVWHYVLVDKMRLPILQKRAQTEAIDLKDFGHILFSGFGEQPPEEVTSFIKQKYTIH